MLELNKCHNENCLDTMKKIDCNSIHMILTSPPYDDLRLYNGFKFDFKPIAKEMYRILINGGVAVWVVGDQTKNGSESLTSFKQALYFKEECGFNCHDTMIFRKKNPIMLAGHKRYNQVFEYIFIFTKGKIKTFNPLIINSKLTHSIKKIKKNRLQEDNAIHGNDRIIIFNDKKLHSNIFSYALGSTKETNRHPAPFPEKLARDHIYTWSNPGEIVYDPFMGSGTTAKMAILLNRKWIGSEISKEYCDIIEQRIDGYQYHPELNF